MDTYEFMRQVELRNADVMRYYDLVVQAKQLVAQATGAEKEKYLALCRGYQVRLSAAQARRDEFLRLHG